MINNDWQPIFQEEMNKPYYSVLNSRLDYEYSRYTVYPEREDIFKAFELTPYNDVKVVIIGQDPYHECGQAEGLAFSVPYGCKIPPSLRNIYKELQDDLGINPPNHGNLRDWALRGVLLINSVLTVREGEANSHKALGWEMFTDNILKALSRRDKPIVFILWGNNARAKKKLIDSNKHYIIDSPHPSPVSARNGFFQSKPFGRANDYLKSEAIDWRIADTIR